MERFFVLRNFVSNFRYGMNLSSGMMCLTSNIMMVTNLSSLRGERVIRCDVLDIESGCCDNLVILIYDLVKGRFLDEHVNRCVHVVKE